MRAKLIILTVLSLLLVGYVGMRLLRLPRVEFVAGLWPG